MMNSVWCAVLAGLAAGAFNGALARWALKKTLNSPDPVFYSVFAGGLLYRLVFLAGSVWLLRREKYIIIVPFAISLILAQMIFEVVPVKKNGIKRDT
ncbi:MAG TPA: hypothetical protein DCL44_06085 [Elusimicrobia bacterium]|nr:hypothetical protein [Elusimicrobiota bacterium]